MITVITGELREGDVGLFAHYVHLREIPASLLLAIVLLFFCQQNGHQIAFRFFMTRTKSKSPKVKVNPKSLHLSLDVVPLFRQSFCWNSQKTYKDKDELKIVKKLESVEKLDDALQKPVQQKIHWCGLGDRNVLSPTRH